MTQQRPRILLTGAAGFIGFHLQKALQADADLVLVDTLEAHQVASQIRAKELKNLQTQVSDQLLAALMKEVSCVIHLAAETGISRSAKEPEIYLENNVSFTMRLLAAAKRAGVEHFIYASSSSVYAPYSGEVSETADTQTQLSFYGTTKKMMEQLVASFAAQHGLKAIGLRFFTVYGSWTRPDMAAYKFMKAITAEQPITIYNPEALQRDFTHVSDIVLSIEGLLKKIHTLQQGQHEIFNIGFGAPVFVRDYALQIASLLEKPLLLQEASLPANEALHTHSNSQKLQDFIGFRPQISAELGIREMVEWFKTRPYG
ncbi:MAG: NAD-dependent epimerase/dehydratase family protein [Flavobacteriales bacterium]